MWAEGDKIKHLPTSTESTTYKALKGGGGRKKEEILMRASTSMGLWHSDTFCCYFTIAAASRICSLGILSTLQASHKAPTQDGIALLGRRKK